MQLAALHSSFRDDPCWQAVNVGDLAPRRRELLPLAALLSADHLIGSRAAKDRESQRPRVVCVESGDPGVEAGHVAVRHGFVVLDLVVARAALDDHTGLGVPDNGFNPTFGFPSLRLPKFFEGVILGRLIDGRHRQRRELWNLAEGAFVVASLTFAIRWAPVSLLLLEVFAQGIGERFAHGPRSPGGEHLERVSAFLHGLAESARRLSRLIDLVNVGRADAPPRLFMAPDPRRLTGRSHLKIEPPSTRMFTLCSHEPGKLAFPFNTLNTFNGHALFPRFFPRVPRYPEAS